MTELEVGKEYWIKAKLTRYDGGLEPPYMFAIPANSSSSYWFERSVEAVEVIPEREEVTIPPYVADWVEQCKVRGDLAEAINPIDFCTDKKVADWYEEQEFAEEILAKAYLVGYVVEEPLGVLLLEFHSKSKWRYHYLETERFEGYIVRVTDSCDVVKGNAHKITEAEAEEKYPNFRWVSLEELENE